MPALRSNLALWSKLGVRGFVALGSTGERMHLDVDERQRVIETAREAIDERHAFIAGVGEHATRTTIRDAQAAARGGADALLVITPHFYRGAMTQESLYTHFMTVADSSTVPVILYNIPQNTGVAIAPETVARLAEHENIAGIKDSSGDAVNFVEMLRLAGGRKDFILLTGHASLLYQSLCAGASGGILAVACVVPEICLRIYESFMSGDYERARLLQERLVPVARAVTTRYGIGGLKHAMSLRGYLGGDVRAPLRAPGNEAQDEIARTLEEALSALAEAASANG